MAEQKKKDTPAPPDDPIATTPEGSLATAKKLERVTIEGPVQIEPTGPIRIEPPSHPVPVESVGQVKVALQRSSIHQTEDQALWVAIRHSTNAIGFNHYDAFLERLLCGSPPLPKHEESALYVREERNRLREQGRLFQGVDAYKLLKAATEAFLILNCGVLLPNETNFQQSEEEGRLGQPGLTLDQLKARLSQYVDTGGLPYLDRVLGDLVNLDAKISPSPFCPTLVTGRPFDPCLLELIWSYWHEEGMLVQAIHAISARFQNKRLSAAGNPLSNLELNPLRPLSNLLWGYVQDEPFRLTVARRTYEYSHHYGLTLIGKAVPSRPPADHRSKFLEAFHSLLHQVSVFYKEDADTTVIANGFPLLNSLKEVHMLLAEGAHNQFGDLPWTARVEMLIQQWLLSRRETLEFLSGRAMFPYKEPWMGPVDTLKRLLGWSDTPVTYFRDLGTFGEQILLGIRYGDWVNVDHEDSAKNWARYWKPEIQGYIHAYRAATGVDLAAADLTRQVNAIAPAILLQRRLARQAVR